MKALSQKRRHPLAALALLVMALLLTGGLYAVATTTNEAKAETTSYSAQDVQEGEKLFQANCSTCLLYTSPSPRDRQKSRMPSSA